MTALRKTHEWFNGKQRVAVLHWNGGGFWCLSGAGGSGSWLSDSDHGDRVFEQADAMVLRSFPRAKVQRTESIWSDHIGAVNAHNKEVETDGET